MLRPYLNLAAYRFFDWDNLAARRDQIERSGYRHGIRGTVLLAPEGINLFVSAPPDAARAWLAELCADPLLAHLEVKSSESDQCEFGRWRVRVKPEIITLRLPRIRPQDRRAAAVAPGDFERWLAQGEDDDGRPLAVIDTRNRFEVAAGSFEGAVDLNIRSFCEFPQAVEALKPTLAGKRVVTFCTGGIRCEKAALLLEQQGIAHVVQLDGGVLRYFEEIGERHWQGELFVFDARVGVTPTLSPTYSPMPAAAMDT